MTNIVTTIISYWTLFYGPLFTVAKHFLCTILVDKIKINVCSFSAYGTGYV